MISAQELAERLADLPSAEDPWFPPRLNNCIFRIDGVRDTLNDIVQGDSYTAETRFKAFYGYLNHARRSLDYSEYDNYHRRHAERFVDFPMIKLLWSQCYLNRIQNGEFSDELAGRALYFAEEARRLLVRHFGVEAHWATTVAEIQSRLPDEDRDLTLIQRALEAQDIALIESGERYPRHFATKARLLQLAGQWDRALAAISVAVDREDSSLADYPIRVGRYQATRSEIETERRMQEIVERSLERMLEFQKEAESVRRDLEETRASSLTLVGLLAAVVAFITTSTSLTSRLPFDEAAKLIGISACSITIVFACLLWLVARADPRRTTLKFAFVIISALLFGTVILTLT